MARVLLVDDVEDLLMSMSALFESYGHDLRLASNGREAFEIAQQFSPQIVFMDLDMPVMTGLEAARLMKARMTTTPYLVAVTGGAREGIELETKAAGFDVCLRKPVDVDLLLTLADEFNA